MARVHLKAGALTAPLPPVIVTVGDMESANMLTVAWTGILSTHPPRTYVSVRPSRHSHALLSERGEFVINLPSADMARTVDYVGIYTGAKVDKFAATGLTKCPSMHVSAPTLAECPIALECRVVEVLSMGTHDVFIADILAVSCDEAILDEAGRMCFERAGLLAYAHGEYFALGERLGEFGFSAKKKGSGARGARQSGGARGHTKGSPERERKAADANKKKALAPERERAVSGERAPRSADEVKPFYLGIKRGKGGKKARGGKR